MSKKDLRFLKYTFQGKDLFIVKHHAVALKCWIKSLQSGQIATGAVLFHIDKHSDLDFNEDNMERSEKLLNLSESELDTFIQHDLRSKNEEFIINAMISGLISDTISIHNEDNRNSKFVKFLPDASRLSISKRNSFSHNGIDYFIYYRDTQDLTGLFDQREGFLGDPVKHSDVRKVYSDSQHLILDIDLDFFTYRNNGIYAKNKRDISRQITSRSFSKILSKAKVITLALEPQNCGLKDDSLEILDVFYHKVFTTLDLEEIKTTFLK